MPNLIDPVVINRMFRKFNQGFGALVFSILVLYSFFSMIVDKDKQRLKRANEDI